MIIGHKYKIKFTESGIYHNPVGEMFSTAVGIYNGIYKGSGSGLTVTVPFMSLVPYRIGIEPEFYKKKYDQYLEFNVGNDDKIKINPETIVYIEDITNPYFCRSNPVRYCLTGSIEERVMFTMLDRRYEIENYNDTTATQINPVMGLTHFMTGSKTASILLKNLQYGHNTDNCKGWYAGKHLDSFMYPEEFITV